MVRAFLALLTLVFCAAPGVALDLFSLPSQKTELLRPSTLSSVLKGDTVVLHWRLAEGTALFRDRLRFRLHQAPHARLGPVVYPPHTLRKDPILGIEQPVYYHKLKIPIKIYGSLTPESSLSVTYQGCTERVCLPIRAHTISLQGLTPAPLSAFPSQALTLLSVLGFLGLGLLLSFTPCVLPMIPILSGLVAGAQKKHAPWRALSYILGVALAYAALGLLVAAFGAGFQSLLQEPWVLISVSALLVIPALSLFSVPHARMPSFFTQRLEKWVSSFQGGSLGKAFLMGLVSTFVVSPCVSAPLVGVLSLIAETGDTLFGGVSLFVMALGMGIPLFALSLGLKFLLPKSGAWMGEIKVLLGVMLLATSVYILSRMLSEFMVSLLSVGLLSGYAGYLLFLSKLKGPLLNILGGGALFASLIVVGYAYKLPKEPDPFDRDVTTLQQLKVALHGFKHRPFLLDYYAEWCSECHLVKKRLASQKLQKVVKTLGVKLIKVDVTTYSQKQEELLKSRSVFGMPTLILYDSTSSVGPVEAWRASGNVSSQEILQGLGHLSGKRPE